MRTILLSLLVLSACGSRPNRACILAENALEIDHLEGTCETVSLSDTADFAIWRLDGGKRLCRDAIGTEHPLTCSVMQPTKAEIARDAKATAEREAKATAESAAKLKVEAEAKARADVAVGPGSAKGPK